MIHRLLLGLLLLATAVTASAQGRDADAFLTLSLLTDTDARIVTTAAKAVERMPATEQATRDVVAELLIERSARRVADRDDIEAVAWLMRALGASHDARYRRAVEQAMAAYGRDKLDEHGKQALAAMAGETAEPYVAGTIALPALRAELAAGRKAFVGGGSIAALPVNATTQTLFATLGYTAELLERVRLHGYGFTVRVRSLRLLYPFQGMVDIANGGRGWAVTGIWPDVPNQAPAYAGQFADDAALVMNSDSQVLVEFAAQLHERGVREPALLDRLAERLRVSLATPDEAEAAALAHFIHLLADSGDRKYVEVLAATVAGAEVGELRGQAKKSLRQLRGS